MQTTYKNGNCVIDKLPSNINYPVDLIQLAKALANSSSEKLDIEFHMAFGVPSFSVNGREPIAFGGYTFAYGAKLLLDELGHVGLFD